MTRARKAARRGRTQVRTAPAPALWPTDPSTLLRGPDGLVMPADWWAFILWAEDEVERLIATYGDDTPSA